MYDKNDIEYYDSNNEETRLRELKELVEGVDIDPDTFQKLSEIQLRFRVAQNHLVDLFDAQTITPEEYLDKFNSLSSEMSKSILELLGKEKYTSIFGEFDYQTVIIDKATFLGQHNDR